LRPGGPRLPAWLPTRRQAGTIAGTIAIAVLGGVVFELLGMPLPWMLGAMLATTLASLGGLALHVPLGWRTPTIAVLGVLLGSGFNPELLTAVGSWLGTILALPLYVLVLSGISLLYLRRIGRLDPLSAYFSATPGGLGEMVLLGDRAGADMRTISLVHATRILLVVFTIPFAFQALGYGAGAMQADAVQPGVVDLAVMAVAGVLGLWLGLRLKLPAGAMLGPMIASAAVHLLGLSHGAPPFALVAAAQLIIGATVGCRFTGYPLHRVLMMTATSFGLTILMLVLTGGFALVLAPLTGLPVPVLFLALAPGGIAEMSLVALALTDDPAFVATVHILRIGLVVLIAPLLLRPYRRLLRLPPS
jgi:membrane AbrB-like protein